MAKKKLDIFLGMDNAELKSKLNESTNLLKGFQTTIGGVLGGAALGISIKSMGDFALEAGRNFEKAAVSFKVFLGSEKEAQNMLKDIEEFASATPLTSSGLQDNAKMLLQFNAVAKSEVIPTLKMLGDVSGGDQEKLNSLTFAFSKAMSTGKLTSKVYNQLVIAGFNPLTVMAEKTGKSMAQLQADMAKGKISAGMLQQAFKDATSEGGRFYNLLKEQSNTKAGLESTKADNLEILARTISTRALPALEDLDRAEIKAIQGATSLVNTIYDWLDVNNQTTNAITNMALALTTAVLGYQGVAAIVRTVSQVHLDSVAAIKAMEAAQVEAAVTAKAAEEAELALYYARLKGDQAMIEECVALKASTAAKATEAAATAKATQATALQYAATGNLAQAFKVATVQVRAFTVSLLANPFTWIAVAIAAVTAAVFVYKNSLEETGKALDDINAKYEQQTRAIDDNITTINRLIDVKKRSVTQEEELNKAVNALIEQYPNILSEYDKEIIKLQGVNKELAKKIYLTTQAAKVEDLQRQKEKIDKKAESQRRGYVMSQTANSARTGMPLNIEGGRYGVRKSVQRDQDRINKELAEAQKLLDQINKNEVSFGTTEEKQESRPKTGGGVSVSASERNKAERAAERARKEAIALRQAQFDAELLQVRKNSEEEYQLQLKKIDAKIALEKVGTAAHQQALNERTKLEQQHQQQVGEIELAAFSNKMELANLEMQREKELLDLEKERGAVSNDEYYNKLLEFEEKKYNLRLEYLNKQQELYKNDLQKFTEIEHQKLIATAEYENQKQQIVNDSIKAESEEWQNLFSEIGSSFQSALGDFIAGNKTLKDSFLGIFNDIKNSFAKMIAQMLAEQAKLAMMKGISNLAGAGGWIGTAANFIKGFFADGGIVPGQYNQQMPIVAHGSEMILNPLQQKNLWNMIATGANAQASAQTTNSSGGSPVIVNNITPVFQSLDPAQGQKMFTNWMKQSGIPIVRESIKNNNHQMRDIVRGV